MATTPNKEGARLTIGRAVQFLEQAPLDPFAGLLLDHARAALRALQEGGPLPVIPTGFR